jgi:hypothetical protein
MGQIPLNQGQTPKTLYLSTVIQRVLNFFISTSKSANKKVVSYLWEHISFNWRHLKFQVEKPLKSRSTPGCLPDLATKFQTLQQFSGKMAEKTIDRSLAKL